MDKTPELTLIAPTEPHTATVIFVHGLGQNTYTWRAMILEGLVPSLPQIRWVMPQASKKAVTYKKAFEPSWFNIKTLPPGTDEFDETTIAESIGIIENLILTEIYGGINPRRIFLVGFSQGAALSLMVALSTLHDLGGVASLSGWIPPKAREQTIASPNLPILWCHGLADTLIPIELAEDAIKYLEQNTKGKVELKKYAGLEHTINDSVVEDLLAWLKLLV
ncbi:Lysophospholipase i [Mycena indigotica]|uniref:Acyl-protein thioesterase 1 n=1 Tax=Mycena indigotica TaxID=2126181 RepID=A0A8H6W6B5_9AGAR|nr:Lysophospholipase i [Mycena indigotica]KAF7306512.1 Lysophospholipase i [Mycena indigotica]